MKKHEKVLRESNIELLRIVLIMMIISHHIIVHGLDLRSITNSNFQVKDSTYIELVLNSFFVIGVNGFVFVSGYFGIKFNIKRIISILIQAVFYSLTFYLIAFAMNQIEFSLASFWKAFFPISTNVWWFITTYIGLYFIAPFLNAGMKSIEKQELSYVFLGLFILNCILGSYWGGISGNGYTLFNFIFIYLIARLMRQNDLKIDKAKLTLLFSFMVTSIWAIILLYFDDHESVWQLFYYNNPLLILSAISLFFIFHKLKLKFNKYINLLAQTVLGVYMIHDYHRHRKFLIEIVNSLSDNYDSFIFVMLLAMLVVGIFLFCSLIELLRLNIFKFASKRIYDLSIIRQLSGRIKGSLRFHGTKGFKPLEKER